MNAHNATSPSPPEDVGRPDRDRGATPRLRLPNGEDWPLTGEALTIGRRVGNHLRIDDAEVSTHHAKIVRSGDDHVLIDLRSANGTFVNGTRVHDLHVLCDGDEIEVASQRFRFTDAPSRVKPAPAVAPAAAGRDEHLAAELGVLLLNEFPLTKQELTIGRGAENGLVVDDPRVSNQHATIVRVGPDYWLLDLRSTNGSFINEQRVRDVHRLCDGDTITIGATTLTFARRKIRVDVEEEAEAEAAPSFVFADASGDRWKRVRLLASLAIVLLVLSLVLLVRFVMQ